MKVDAENKNKSFSKKIIIGIRKTILDTDRKFGRFILIIKIKKFFFALFAPIPGADFRSSKEASFILSIPPKYLMRFIFNTGPSPSIPSKLDEKRSLDRLFL